MSGDGTGGARPAGEYSIGDVAVRIGGWIVSSLQSIADAISNFVMGGGGGMEAAPGGMRAAGEGITLSGVLVNIGGWAQGVIEPFWETVKGWFTGGGGGMEAAPGGMRAVSGGGIDIPSVLVNIGQWVKGEWDDLTTWLDTKVKADLVGFIGQIPSVTVDIVNFVVTTNASLWGKVWEFLGGLVSGRSMEAAPGGMRASSSSGGFPFPQVLVEINDFLVNADSVGFWAAMEKEVEELFTFSDATISRLSAKGAEHGRKLGEAFGTALIDNLLPSIDSGMQSSPGGMRASGMNADKAASAYADPFIDAFIDGVVAAIENAEWDKIGQAFIKMFVQQFDQSPEWMKDIPIFGGKHSINDLLGDFDTTADISLDANVNTDAMEAALAKSIFDLGQQKRILRLERFKLETGRDPVAAQADISNPTVKPVFDPNRLNVGAFRELNQLVMNTRGSVVALNSTPVSVNTSAASAGLSALKSTAESTRTGLDALKTASTGVTVDTSSAVANLGSLKSSVDTTGSAFGTLKTAGTGVTVDTAGAVSSLKILSAAIDESQLKLSGLAGNAAYIEGANAAKGAAQGAAIKITADHSDAMAKIAEVRDAIAGLGGGGGPAALKGAAMGAGGITITADNSAAMLAIGDVSAGLFGLSSMTSSVVISGDNAAAMQSIGDVSAGMAGINGMSSTVVLLGDNGAAMRSIGDVSAGMAGIDGMTATIYVKGDNSDAMAAINAVKAYAGTSLGSATFTVNTVTTRSPAGVGAGMGRGLLSGWDRATGTRSPSTEMIKRGQYLYKGLDLGWAGSASNLPIGFDVANPAYARTAPLVAPSGAGASGSNAPTYNVYVTVEGNVTSERTLTATITREIANGIRSDLIRHRTASGVAS